MARSLPVLDPLGVRAALLEESPSRAAVAALDGPAVVVGLFAVEGLRAGVDVSQLVSELELERERIAFAGNIGAFAGVVGPVAAAVARASTGGAE